MNNSFESVCTELSNTPKKWLITGCAGFIGSNLLEKLLLLDQKVMGLDNFSTGYQHNLDAVEAAVSAEQWSNFTLMQGDIRSVNTCEQIVEGVDYVLHQAALGSVPRSIEDPQLSHDVNITGQLNILEAAKKAGVKKVVYAASSSTYGDHPALPKLEHQIGKPLSPYAVTKYVNELYADVYNRCYGLNSVGLRYFNVYGPRQDPKGAYAAVIPLWVDAMLSNESININGDGETSRDFCFINNVVQANILAAVSIDVKNDVFNVACGDRNTLNQLFGLLKTNLNIRGIEYSKEPVFKPFREGDVRHSQADISKIHGALGYVPTYNLADGLAESIRWYINDLLPSKS